ncbi:P12 family lipoprotein (plasmid) [Borrelia anserina]|nr:P12 family lipoprotein [Borrelia anserina]APR65417.1 putative lipoprotein [Borrelia anserina Es]UPA07286.1 P12 family lipoprotein [Borrelia anserina]
MNKIILAILISFCFFSCGFGAFDRLLDQASAGRLYESTIDTVNELLDKLQTGLLDESTNELRDHTEAALLDKSAGVSIHQEANSLKEDQNVRGGINIQGDQGDVIDYVGGYIEGRLEMNQVVYPNSIELPVAESSVNLVPYSYEEKYQEKITIRKEDLVPITDEEIDADKKIKEVENIIKNNEFPAMLNGANKLLDEYKQLKINIFHVMERLKDKINLLKSKNISSGNKNKIRDLNKFSNQLYSQLFEFEACQASILNAIGEIELAQDLFEKSKEALRKAIINRLENNSNRVSSLRQDIHLSANLSREAWRNAETSLNKVESAVFNLNEVSALMRSIERYIDQIEPLSNED